MTRGTTTPPRVSAPTLTHSRAPSAASRGDCVYVASGQRSRQANTSHDTSMTTFICRVDRRDAVEGPVNEITARTDAYA